MYGPGQPNYFQPQPPPRRGLGCGGAVGIGLALLVGIGLIGWIRGARETRAVVADAGAPMVSAAPVANSAAVVDGHLRDAFTVAGFKDDVLDECVDWTLEIVPAPDASVPPESAAKLLGEMRKAMAKGTPVKGTCDDNFADRPCIAACTATKVEKGKGGGEVRVTASAGYYAFEAIGLSDAHRRDCLQMGGKWHVVEADSEAWHRAKSDHARRKLEKLTK